MQACVDWVLIIFGTQVIKEKQSFRPVLPDYFSVSDDYDSGNKVLSIPFDIYKNKVSNIFKFNNTDTRAMSGASIVNFEHISHFTLLSLMLNWNK